MEPPAVCHRHLLPFRTMSAGTHLSLSPPLLLSSAIPPRGPDAPTPGVADVPTLYVTLLDAISCRVLHRVAHFYASGPVSLAMVENWLVYSYWNTRAQRTEVRGTTPCHTRLEP